jgi:hypothetical protein
VGQVSRGTQIVGQVSKFKEVELYNWNNLWIHVPFECSLELS